MKTLLRWFAVSMVTLFTATAALAQPRFFNQGELDQMLAPVALYPDSLLSQLLMAATYPREVAEAAAWSRANPRLIGDQAVRAVENEPWDPSVKSLVAFPQVLAMMGERPDWTQRLGDAFVSAPEQVSDTVQGLRRRADDAGTLRSSDEMKVYRDDRYYTIEPASPEVVFVPYYDPRVVYGRWWWPAYQPIWWRPWVGYDWYPGYNGFGWGYGITVGSGFFYSGWDWPSRYIFFRSNWPHYYRGWDQRHGHRWWHDGVRRSDGRWDVRRRDGNRDGNRDGRWDGRRRDGDRDGRPDGRGDGRRDGDRDGRPDGRGDGRRDGDRNRDGRRGSRDGVTPAPTASTFAPAAPNAPQYQSPARADQQPRVPAPRVQSAAPVGRGYGHSQPAPQAPVAAPSAPVAAQPVGRAPAPAPVVRESRPPPAARESRSEPAARESRSEPAARESRSDQPVARESRSEDSRSGGRGNGERSRPH